MRFLVERYVSTEQFKEYGSVKRVVGFSKHRDVIDITDQSTDMWRKLKAGDRLTFTFEFSNGSKEVIEL